MDGLDMTLLSDSMEKNGQLVPLTICDGVIVDGYRRYLIARSLGWADIATHEVEGDPESLRIVAQTRHTEFGRDEKRALVGDHLCKHRDATAASIAHAYQWSPVEVESLAGVDYLIPHWRQLYLSGDITLAEVWHLSRVRDRGQLQLVEDDGDEPLYDRAAALHREVRAARRRSMVTRPRGKGYNAIVREREKLTEAGLCLIQADAKTPVDGWTACLDWILSAGH